MRLSQKLILALALAASIRCNRASSVNQPPAPLPDVHVVTLEQLMRPHEGPSKEQIAQFHFKAFQQAIDSNLMPHADAKTRDRLISIKAIFDKVDRDGAVFLKSADNNVELTRAFADMILIAGNIYPGDMNFQLQAPAELLKLVNTLEIMRDIGTSRDLAPDIARYTSEALKFAGRTVERFPNTGKAYGELAFVLSLTGGSREEMRRLYKRCLELDSGAKFCRDSLRLASE